MVGDWELPAAYYQHFAVSPAAPPDSPCRRQRGLHPIDICSSGCTRQVESKKSEYPPPPFAVLFFILSAVDAPFPLSNPSNYWGKSEAHSGRVVPYFFPLPPEKFGGNLAGALGMKKLFCRSVTPPTCVGDSPCSFFTSAHRCW